MRDFVYESDDVKDLIEEAIVANVIKSVIFNGKVTWGTLRVDSVVDYMIFIPETQEVDGHDEEIM